MGMLRVGYKRTFQTRPYETQVIELAIEEETDHAMSARFEATRKLYQQLEAIGDQLMKAALARPDPAGRT